MIVVPSLVSDQVYPLEYEMRELDSLCVSHSYFGVANKEYPQFLQPRNSASFARHHYLSKIYANFDAWQFLAEFRQLALGTPILIEGNYVAVGNGRCAILSHAYHEAKWQAQSYRDLLTERAKELGLSVKGFDKPVLVRRVMRDVDVVLFVNEANMRSNQAYSKEEWARVDAHFINGLLLLKLEVKESTEETLTAAANRQFVSSWLAKLPESERNSVLDPRTLIIDLAGIARLERALLARVYGVDWLTRLTYDSFDNDVRSLTNALRWSVVKVAQVEELIAQGQRESGASIVKDVLEAVEVFLRFKKSGQKSLKNFLAQGSFMPRSETCQMLVLMFYKNKRSGKKIKAQLDAWCDYVLAMPNIKAKRLI